MKLTARRAFALALAILAGGVLIRAALPASSALKSFTFLGCSGDWEDAQMAPQVWRAETSTRSTFLIKHPATCGSTIGTHARAVLNGASVDLSYELGNDSKNNGAVPACSCEYWAAFELESMPGRVETVSLNGQKALLMSGLNAR